MANIPNSRDRARALVTNQLLNLKEKSDVAIQTKVLKVLMYQQSATLMVLLSIAEKLEVDYGERAEGLDAALRVIATEMPHIVATEAEVTKALREAGKKAVGGEAA